jgi:hypothetical protein
MQLPSLTQMFLSFLSFSTSCANPILTSTHATDLLSTTEAAEDRPAWGDFYQYSSTDCKSGQAPFSPAIGTQAVICDNYNGTYDGSALTTGNTDYKNGGWYYCLYALPDCEGTCHKIGRNKQCIGTDETWKIRSISITPGPF